MIGLTFRSRRRRGGPRHQGLLARLGRPTAADDAEGLSPGHLALVAPLAIAVIAFEHEPLWSVAIIATQIGVVGYLLLRGRVRGRHRRRDDEQLERITRQAGLRMARPGEFELYSLPFPALRQGEWQGFDNVYIGEWDGDRVWVFDTWYGFTVKGQDVEEHFTCAAMQIDADCPKLAISRENPWSRTWGHLGWRDIELEYDTFNRHFDVSGDDREFAFALLDGSMMEWLMTTPKDFEFAVDGSWFLCRSKQLPTERWWDLLRMARDFRGRMPESLGRLYR